jgi:hypothetical protein
MTDNIQSHVSNNNSSKLDTIKDARDAQHKLNQALYDQLYNYDLYGANKSTKDKYLGGKYTSAGGTNASGALTTMSNLLEDNLTSHKATLDLLQDNAARLGDTYDYSSDMYRNQKYTNDSVKLESDIIKKRHDAVIGSIEENQRQFEIYRYYYYKNKIQLHILYSFLIYLAVMIVLTFVHNLFPIFVTNTMYVILFGVGTAAFFIYLCRRLYDIYLRSDVVFDEYDPNWKPPPIDASGAIIETDSQRRLKDKKAEKCKTETSFLSSLLL